MLLSRAEDSVAARPRLYQIECRRSAVLVVVQFHLTPAMQVELTDKLRKIKAPYDAVTAA
jgi:hypothetical protein